MTPSTSRIRCPTRAAPRSRTSPARKRAGERSRTTRRPSGTHSASRIRGHAIRPHPNKAPPSTSHTQHHPSSTTPTKTHITCGATPLSTLARLDRVTRRFGDITALDDVSLEIGSGRIVGLLGPNGAGKSTLLSLLQGQRRPTSGTVELLGGNPSDARSRRGLGCTPQQTALPPVLRVGEVIDLVSAHFENPIPKQEIAEEFGFSDLLRRQTGSLSGGQQRRISVALAFVSRPKLVLLDEPTTGLDVD